MDSQAWPRPRPWPLRASYSLLLSAPLLSPLIVIISTNVVITITIFVITILTATLSITIIIVIVITSPLAPSS